MFVFRLLNKLFYLSLFISLFSFSFNVQSEEEKEKYKIKKFKENEFYLECQDYEKHHKRKKNIYLKTKTITDVLEKKYRLHREIFEQHIYEDNGTGSKGYNITNRNKGSFCEDDPYNPESHIIINTLIKTSIVFYEIECRDEKGAIDVVDLKKLFDQENISYPKGEDEWIAYYSRLKDDNYNAKNGFICLPDPRWVHIHFSETNNIENGSSNQPDETCDVTLDDTEILKHPVVCKDVIEQRIKDQVKSAEITKITEELNTFLSKSTSGEWKEILTDTAIEKITVETDNLEKDHQTLKNEELLKDRLETITELLQPIVNIFDYYNSYFMVCIAKKYLFTNSSSENYAIICESIENKKSDWQWLENKISSYELKTKSNFLTDFDLLKINVEAEINNIIEENKEKEAEGKSTSEVKEKIDPLIEETTDKISRLDIKIKGDVMDLDVFNNNFDINETYSQNYDDLEESISKKIKIIDGLFFKIGNLIKKFPESYDSSSYQQQQSLFSQQIDVLNTENEKLVNKIKTAQSKLKEQADKKLEDEKKQKELEKKKKEKEDKALAETNLRKLEDDIDEKIIEIENALKNIKTRISNEIQLIKKFKEIFNPRETYSNNYDNLEKEILDDKKYIERLIDELQDLIKKLPKDYDTLDYDDERLNAKRDLKDIDTETLIEEITSAISLLESQDEKKEKILEDQDLLITQLKDKIKILEDNKTTSEKDLLEKLTASETVNEELKDDIETHEGIIEDLEKTSEVRKTLMIILIVILVISLGLIIYLFVRRKSSRDDDASANTRKHLSRIDDLERELENKNASLRSQVKASDAPILDREPEKKEEVVAPPPDPQKEKYNELMKLYKDYDAAMKDPNQVEVFMKAYNAEGLEREARLASKGKTTLRKVNKPFHRADFWLVQHDNKWLIFGGRILKVQAPSFLADDGTRARNLMQGIFQLEFGIDFKTVRCAIVNKINQIYEVRTEGKLQLPKTDS